jgi:hypothetical protein
MTAVRLLLAAILLTASACSTPTPQAASPKPTAPSTARAATPTLDPAATALKIIPLRIEESELPPPEPTPQGFAAGRPTPTPDATPEAAWKYLTIVFGVENTSDVARLVGIGGPDGASTNLAGAVLSSPDGKRYKPLRSTTTFGLRTATARSLTTYPVLLRLPPGFGAVAESSGTLSVVAPERNSLTFKIPSSLGVYGTLTIPPLTSLGPKTGDDDVTRVLRPLVGGFQPLDLGSVATGVQPGALPPATSSTTLQGVGSRVSGPGKVTVTLVSVDVSDPADYQIRNRGWKQVSLAVQYRNDDPQQAHDFNVAAWLFGDDGVVYTGDAPTIGDFGRSLTPPQPSAILMWDGRSAGADHVAAGQTQEPRRLVFVMPGEVRGGILVLVGDVEAMYRVADIPTPPRQP